MKKFLAGLFRNGLVLLLGAAVTIAPLLLQIQAATIPVPASEATFQNQHLAFDKSDSHGAQKQNHKILGTEAKEKESEEDESDSSFSKRSRNGTGFGISIFPTALDLCYQSTHQPPRGNNFHCSSTRMNILIEVFRI